jgi:ubiquinone/menaquinone biosynthesis C-methylase UbiE
LDWNEFNKWFRWHFQREIKDFVHFIIHELDVGSKARILEIGSGPGWIGLELAARMPDSEIMGLEPNAELMKIADQNKIHENITNVTFVNETTENLSTFANRSFDCVISFKGLSQWNFPLKVFKEINRILKKDGTYAIIDYRKDLKWLAKASIWFTARTMSQEFHSFWKDSIVKSYSLEEIVKILLQTKLKDWKIRTTLFDFLIYSVIAENSEVEVNR